MPAATAAYSHLSLRADAVHQRERHCGGRPDRHAEQKEYYQGCAPRHYDVPHQLFECRYVEQKRINMDADQVDKAEKVGNRKEFTKGNDVVQRAMHLKVSVWSPHCLQQKKQDSINLLLN